ncbi:MAG TPA: protein-glutamate O-methyltransferase CheR [bacterium]|jgi:chemotaxis protein methyltransferase CheR|nr:protein-glutamate O-methyltransferase CheR [bacterium]HNW15413.1 protein-glutamate O-methyltransferase CheR [bacterium]HOB70570.1 protein-glutamate O-methyltransferase CheR [bacterium]HOG43787.1 protein-glutamate O-methyltransferase CheR [bacterium]HPV20448.1 protein-glutamate O-methyltransferase CheR [bacterium]
MNTSKFEIKKISLSDSEFDKLRELVYKISGISLANTKKELVISRFSKRLKELKLSSFGEYHDLLVSPGGFSEVQNFINSITTNKTDFFRESHHFDFIVSTFIPQVVASSRPVVRVWSAACSTGEEPYTIAMVMSKYLVEPYGIPVKILATDIDTNVLKAAARGVYDSHAIGQVPEKYLKKYFLRGKGDSFGLFKVKDDIRSMVTFKQLNFIAPEYPITATFDIIFCRNVIIYFSPETKKQVVGKLFRYLSEGGYIMMGHSETLFNMIEGLVYLKNTVYQKRIMDK